MNLLLRLLAFAALTLSISPAAAADLTVDAGSGFVVQAEINGHPVRLRVDPETSGYIILNPSAVERIGLKSSLIGSLTRIGPVKLTGSSKVARVRIGESEGRRRLVWIDRSAVDGADGLIGPADMPFDSITFRLRPDQEGVRRYVLPFEFRRSLGLFHSVTIGDQSIPIQLSTMKEFSMATGAAGAHLASLHSGRWTGEARDAIIEFGVVRPVRPLQLDQVIELEGLRINQFLVRTADHRGDLDLPPDPEADPDEIVITGSTSRQRARFGLTLGLDALSACSRLVWDNGSQQMTFYCSQ